MKRKLSAIMGAIVAAIFIPIILSDSNDKIDTYLLGGFIISEVIIFVFDQIFQSKRETWEDRKTHSKEFLTALEILDGADISCTRTKFDVCVPYPYKNYKLQQSIVSKTGITFDELENRLGKTPHHRWISYEGIDEANFEGLLEHLKHKKYKDSYDKWTKLQNKLKEHTEKYHPYPNKELSDYELLKFYDDNFEVEGFMESQKKCVRLLTDFYFSLESLIKELRGVKIIEGKCQWCPN